MAIFDLYSKRRDRELNGVRDVYSYDAFSANFRVQLSMMIKDLLGDERAIRNAHAPQTMYDYAVGILKKEYGVKWLSENSAYQDTFKELHQFIEDEPDVEKCLDAVELSYRLGNHYARDTGYRGSYDPDASTKVDDCIKELNARFKEAGYGYEFIGGDIIRIDSGLLHAETVIPAIHFLNYAGFDAARNEFLGAHEHYRHERYKEALVDAGKSLESTIKIICTANDWPYGPRDTANKLIQILIEKGFIPSLHQSHLSAIQSVLTSGIPTLRNNLGGHGAGPEVVEVSAEIVAYGLHLTASAIVMLAGLQAKRSGAP